MKGKQPKLSLKRSYPHRLAQNHTERSHAGAGKTTQTMEKSKISWAQTVKEDMSFLGQLPETPQNRINKNMDLSRRNGLWKELHLKPVKDHSISMKGRPNETVRTAIPTSPSAWALLRLCFIGSPIVELITDEKLKDCLMLSLEMMNIKQLECFAVLNTTIHRQDVNENTGPRRRTGLQTAQFRIPHSKMHRNPGSIAAED